MEISCDAAIGYVLANQARSRGCASEPERAGTLLEEAAARFARDGDERGEAPRARAPRLPRALPRAAGRRAPLLRAGAGAAPRHARPARRRDGALGARGSSGTISGDYRRAERPLAEARDLFRRAGDRWGLVSALWRTADLASRASDLEEAEAALEEARAVVGETERLAGSRYGRDAGGGGRLRGDASARGALLEQARALPPASDEPGAEA